MDIEEMFRQYFNMTGKSPISEDPIANMFNGPLRNMPMGPTPGEKQQQFDDQRDMTLFDLARMSEILKQSPRGSADSFLEALYQGRRNQFDLDLQSDLMAKPIKQNETTNRENGYLQPQGQWLGKNLGWGRRM